MRREARKWLGIMCMLFMGLSCAYGQEAMSVSRPSEFIAAIGSDRTLLLNPGTYVLSGQAATKTKTDNAIWEEVFDGQQLVIQNVKNLKISAAQKGSVKILVAPRYAYVMTFKNVNGLSLENIELGHTGQKGYCTGGVIMLDTASDVAILNCMLQGSGHEGLTLSNVQNLQFTDSAIKECTYSILSATGSSVINFKNAEFFNNKEFPLIVLDECQKVRFEQCNIHDNKAGTSEDYSHDSLFDVRSCSEVVVQGGQISGNKTQHLANKEGVIDFKDCQFGGNVFEKGKFME